MLHGDTKDDIDDCESDDSDDCGSDDCDSDDFDSDDRGSDDCDSDYVDESRYRLFIDQHGKALMIRADGTLVSTKEAVQIWQRHQLNKA